MWVTLLRSFLLAVMLMPAALLAQTTAPTDARVTILYDAFGKNPALKKDWGYSALVEYGGKRILFDTGNNNDFFAQNVRSLNVDLTRLDFVVLSHRHGDHTSGLNHVLSMNPDVIVYAPTEIAGFGTPSRTMKSLTRLIESLRADMKYMDGQVPDTVVSGTPWPKANFKQVAKITEVIPGFFLIPVVSDVTGTKEMVELSLAIKTSKGLAVVVGCSHPGIEKILDAVTSVDKRIYALFGGFHFAGVPDKEVSRIIGAFHDHWKIERMAPGHCTGEFAFSETQKLFSKRYDYAGVGSVIELE